MHMETLALLITRKTYSIAVACLSAEVLEVAPEDIYGQFLVINEPAARWDNSPPTSSCFRNRLYGVEDFYDLYKVPAGDQMVFLGWLNEDGQFFKVKRLRHDEAMARREARLAEEARKSPGFVRVDPSEVRYAHGWGGYAR